MTKAFIFILTLFALSLFADTEKFVMGTVNVSNKLNVRVKPGKQYFVVASLKSGDRVKIYRKVGDWYEIAAPADSSVWLAGHLVVNSHTRRAVNLRAGPSSDYQAYRTEAPGVELKIIKQNGHGGWFKIQAPSNLKAWVNSHFVVLDSVEKLKELERNQHHRKLVLIDHETGDFAGFLKKETKPKFFLHFIKGMDQEASLSGQIVPLKADAIYVTHALIKPGKDGNFKTLAYLHCEKASLNIWKGKLVNIEGTKKFVRDWKLPIFEVKTVLPQHEAIKNK